MTKLSSILIPGLGGVTAICGLAYAIPTMQYQAQIAANNERIAAQAIAQAEAIEAEAAAAAQSLDAIKVAAEAGAFVSGVPAPQTAGFGLGREALPVEIAAWDIDVRPDGAGLPVGSGDVWTGEEVFVEKCAMCHGDFGEAVGRWPVLAGGHGTLSNEDPVKTIGSYWPYLSTVYDYINRAMPFGMAQSLTNDEVYAITAYLLYVNDLVDDDFELSNENFVDVRLPNEPNFYMDDRATTEYPIFAGDVCMTDCKDSVTITMRATVLDVTPDDGSEGGEEAAEEEPAETEEASVEPEKEHDPEYAFLNIQGDPAYGEYLSGDCTSCHQLSGIASNIPSILGWPRETFMLAMHDFKIGVRENQAMEMMASRLSYEEIAALAAYFESLE